MEENTLFHFTKNITEQKLQQLKIKQEEEESKRMLKEALLSAESSNNAKSDFLARISHDIRTPMNAIIGMTTLAKEKEYELTQCKKSIDTIETSAKFLLSLINDILDMSKIESGKMKLTEESFAFRKFIKNVDTLVLQQVNAKNIHFLTQVDPEVSEEYIGDSLKIQQVLMNLLSNALKFTPKNGKVSLEIARIKSTNQYDTLRFVVTDTGIGMDDDVLERLFRPFEQGDKTIENRFGGSGLGLAIANTIS